MGKARHPGQRIQFIYTRGEPGVFAWGLERPLDPRTIDVAKYTELTLRAVQEVLQPWGVTRIKEMVLHAWRQGTFLFR